MANESLASEEKEAPKTFPLVCPKREAVNKKNEDPVLYCCVFIGVEADVDCSAVCGKRRRTPE